MSSHETFTFLSCMSPCSILLEKITPFINWKKLLLQYGFIIWGIYWCGTIFKGSGSISFNTTPKHSFCSNSFEGRISTGMFLDFILKNTIFFKWLLTDTQKKRWRKQRGKLLIIHNFPPLLSIIKGRSINKILLKIKKKEEKFELGSRY